MPRIKILLLEREIKKKQLKHVKSKINSIQSKMMLLIESNQHLGLSKVSKSVSSKLSKRNLIISGNLQNHHFRSIHDSKTEEIYGPSYADSKTMELLNKISIKPMVYGISSANFSANEFLNEISMFNDCKAPGKCVISHNVSEVNVDTRERYSNQNLPRCKLGSKRNVIKSNLMRKFGWECHGLKHGSPQDLRGCFRDLAEVGDQGRCGRPKEMKRARARAYSQRPDRSRRFRKRSQRLVEKPNIEDGIRRLIESKDSLKASLSLVRKHRREKEIKRRNIADRSEKAYENDFEPNLILRKEQSSKIKNERKPKSKKLRKIENHQRIKVHKQNRKKEIKNINDSFENSSNSKKVHRTWEFLDPDLETTSEKKKMITRFKPESITSEKMESTIDMKQNTGSDELQANLPKESIVVNNRIKASKVLEHPFLKSRVYENYKEIMI